MPRDNAIQHIKQLYDHCHCEKVCRIREELGTSQKEGLNHKYYTDGFGSCTSLDKTDVESTFCPPNRANDLVRVGRNSGDGFLDCVDNISDWRGRGRYLRRCNRHFCRERIGGRGGHGNFAADGTFATNCPGGFVITFGRCIVPVMESVVNCHPMRRDGSEHLLGSCNLIFTRLAFCKV